MNRDDMLQRALDRREPWDILVVGGGATGMGIAVDAATRGYAVLLLERHDFGKGTSSRSTKLIHGGVRYLAQGNLALVREALEERGLLLQNAPHLVRDLCLVLPGYAWWDVPYYGLGLKFYQLLAHRYSRGATQRLSRQAALDHLPTLRADGLRGGVMFHDGQFDDARLLLHLAMTAAEHGATILNYAPVTGVTKNAAGLVDGVRARDEESGNDLSFNARVVINATGAFCDAVRGLADPTAAPLVRPSQGIHIVLAHRFLPGASALLVPRTSDGRVLFAIPWHGHVLVGTTDVPLQGAPLEPRPTNAEIDFLLETVGRYLRPQPTRGDILSTFAGVRPLVRRQARATASLSREHTIRVDPSGLVTITGGKWTTYRSMAEDCVNRAARRARLPPRPCRTRSLRLHGFEANALRLGPLAPYGSDAVAIADLAAATPELARPLHTELPSIGAEVVWAVRNEMARTVEDVLARRMRSLFLNARAAAEMAPRVASLMAAELGWDERKLDEQVRSFQELARAYLPPP